MLSPAVGSFEPIDHSRFLNPIPEVSSEPTQVTGDEFSESPQVQETHSPLLHRESESVEEYKEARRKYKKTPPSDLLARFNQYAHRKINDLSHQHIIKGKHLPFRGLVNQGIAFCKDGERLVDDFIYNVKYETASFAKAIATIVLSPLALFAEMGRACKKEISASTCLKNIFFIPARFIESIFDLSFYTLRTVNGIVSAASISVGFLVWHGGERIVRVFSGNNHTVLSNEPRIRDIVYNSLGVTLLAAAAVFIPVPPIQLIALPIILGSIYGTLNNQFTIRECPEYYTMGHYYDGTSLEGHAIKTNHVAIKPIVTGCYATTFVTKIAGVILAATGTLPYAAAIFPVSLAATVIVGTCAVGLITAHIFATMKKKAMQKNLQDYFKLVGLEWNEDTINNSWRDLEDVRWKNIEQKRKELASRPEELKDFNDKLDKVDTYLDGVFNQSIDTNSRIAIKYLAGWNANGVRNGVGYAVAGVGTIGIAVASVFFRVFAL